MATWTQNLGEMPTLMTVLGAMVLFALAAVLWLFGSRLIKPLCGLTGLAMGAGLGWLGHQLFEPGSTPSQPFWMGIGGVVGMAVALILFRFWMGVSLAVILAIVAPVSVLAWHNIAPPPLVPVEPDLAQTQADAYGELPEPDISKPDISKLGLGFAGEAVVEKATEEAKEKIGEKIGEKVDAVRERVGAEIEEAAKAVGREALGWSQRQSQAIKTWWSDQRSVITGMIVTGTIAGLAIGGTLGIFMPKTAAAIASGILSTVFALAGLQSLLLRFSPDAYATVLRHPRIVFLTMLVIATAGIATQAMWMHKKDDENK